MRFKNRFDKLKSLAFPKLQIIFFIFGNTKCTCEIRSGFVPCPPLGCWTSILCGRLKCPYDIFMAGFVPLDRLIKWLKNWLSHLHSHKNLSIFIRDMFLKEILLHIFFKVSLKAKHKTQLFKHKVPAS